MSTSGAIKSEQMARGQANGRLSPEARAKNASPRKYRGHEPSNFETFGMRSRLSAAMEKPVSVSFVQKAGHPIDVHDQPAGKLSSPGKQTGLLSHRDSMFSDFLENTMNPNSFVSRSLIEMIQSNGPSPADSLVRSPKRLSTHENYQEYGNRIQQNQSTGRFDSIPTKSIIPFSSKNRDLTSTTPPKMPKEATINDLKIQNERLKRALEVKEADLLISLKCYQNLQAKTQNPESSKDSEKPMENEPLYKLVESLRDENAQLKHSLDSEIMESEKQRIKIEELQRLVDRHAEELSAAKVDHEKVYGELTRKFETLSAMHEREVRALRRELEQATTDLAKKGWENVELRTTVQNLKEELSIHSEKNISAETEKKEMERLVQEKIVTMNALNEEINNLKRERSELMKFLQNQATATNELVLENQDLKNMIASYERGRKGLSMDQIEHQLSFLKEENAEVAQKNAELEKQYAALDSKYRELYLLYMDNRQQSDELRRKVTSPKLSERATSKSSPKIDLGLDSKIMKSAETQKTQDATPTKLTAGGAKDEKEMLNEEIKQLKMIEGVGSKEFQEALLRHSLVLTKKLEMTESHQSEKDQTTLSQSMLSAYSREATYKRAKEHVEEFKVETGDENVLNEDEEEYDEPEEVKLSEEVSRAENNSERKKYFVIQPKKSIETEEEDQSPTFG